jgi:hypothetical protein
MKNRLPEYWVVKRDKSNPNWKKVINYLNQISGYEWEGDAYAYYGIEKNIAPGVNCYDTFSYFKGNPTLLTIEQFMELTNQKENKLPKYWVVERDETNPDWKKVIEYLNKKGARSWIGDAFNYYGFDGNELSGVNCWDKLSHFKGNPTLLTIEQFMKLSNQNTMEDFKVKGTKLPVIPNGTYFRCVNTGYDGSDSQYIGNNYDLVSFGCKDFKGETYILADHKDYHGENYLMFKESILQELYKEQNLTEQKSETMVTIKREQLQEIHDIACSTWKVRIKELAQEQPFGDIELSQTQVDEMFKAATSTQLPVLEKIFGKQEEPINFHRVLSLIEPRRQGNLSHKSFFLPVQYNYEIVRDSDGVDCLVPTRKK